jgi:hypothetical protein
MRTIRVALAEDSVLLREGVSRLAGANDDFELVLATKVFMPMGEGENAGGLSRFRTRRGDVTCGLAG